MAHFYFSVFYCTPLLLVGFSRYFSSSSTGKPWSASASGFLLFIWIFVEAIRFHAGFSMSRLGHSLYGIAFCCLCVVPQIIIMAVYLGKISYKDDIEFSICLFQLVFLTLETIVGTKLCIRLGANDTINFYIRLGMIQRSDSALDRAPLVAPGPTSPAGAGSRRFSYTPTQLKPSFSDSQF